MKGLNEPDGEKAVKVYQQLLTQFPKSTASAYALDRLKQYYIVREPKKSEQYNRLLNERFPNYKTPDFGWSSEVQAAKVEPIKSEKEKEIAPPEPQQTAGQGWSIQVGAFKNRKSAEATGRQVTRFGKVNYIDRVVEGKKLIAVQVGRYPNKYEAQRIAAQISGSTGLQTTIVRASP